jgi:class 3 adenylate cyclase
VRKPKAIEWLEQETGAPIEYPRGGESTRDRHLSVRLTAELAARLDEMAAEHGISVSQLVRRLLSDATRERVAVTDLDSYALADRLAAEMPVGWVRRLAG